MSILTEKIGIILLDEMIKNIDISSKKIYNRIMNIRPDKSKSKSINNVWGGLISMGFFFCPVGNPKTPPFRRPDEKEIQHKTH